MVCIMLQWNCRSIQRDAPELCRSHIKEMSLPKKFDHNKRLDPGSFTTWKEWRRGGLVEKLPVKLSRDPLCSFRSLAKWRFDRLNYSALDFVFRPCLTISALEKIRFSLRDRPVTGLAENEYGKRRNEEKEGFNVGWSGETGKLHGDTMNSVSADSTLCDLPSVLVIVNWAILLLILGAREVCGTAHSQRHPQGYTRGRFARFKVSAFAWRRPCYAISVVALYDWQRIKGWLGEVAW